VWCGVGARCARGARRGSGARCRCAQRGARRGAVARVLKRASNARRACARQRLLRLPAHHARSTLARPHGSPNISPAHASRPLFVLLTTALCRRYAHSSPTNQRQPSAFILSSSYVVLMFTRGDTKQALSGDRPSSYVMLRGYGVSAGRRREQRRAVPLPQHFASGRCKHLRVMALRYRMPVGSICSTPALPCYVFPAC